MNNYKQPGDVLTVAAPSGGVTVNQAVVIGNLRGFAVATAAEGEDVAIARKGVFTTTIKATGTAWAVGDLVYLKADGTEFNKTASGNTLFGFCAAPAAAGDTSADICLT